MLQNTTDKNKNVRIRNIGPTVGARQHVQQAAAHRLLQFVHASVPEGSLERPAREHAFPEWLVPERG